MTTVVAAFSILAMVVLTPAALRVVDAPGLAPLRRAWRWPRCPARSALDLPHPSLTWMVATHGVLNALGSATCAILAWRRLEVAPLVSERNKRTGRRGGGRSRADERSEARA